MMEKKKEKTRKVSIQKQRKSAEALWISPAWMKILRLIMAENNMCKAIEQYCVKRHRMKR